MNAIDVVFGFRISHPPGVARDLLERGWQRAYSPLLRELGKHPELPVVLHVGGTVLDFLEAEHPEGIERMQLMVQRGQLELIGGGYYEPVLSAIPERDAVGQLRLCARRHKHLVGETPQGAMLAYGAWDPCLPRLLQRADLRYAVMESCAFRHAGLEPEQVDGHFAVERQGKTVAVFPDLAGEDPVHPGMEPTRVLGLLRRYASRRRRLVVWMLDAREFGLRPGSDELSWGRSGGWIPRLLGQVATQDHWLKFTTFSQLLARLRPTARVYLPACMEPAMQALAVPPEPAVPKGRPAVTATLSGIARGRPPAALPWETFLARFAEANRLHKRMLVSSREVARLASKVRKQGKTRRARLMGQGLERALLWLYQAQAAAPCTPDPWGGFYDGRLRQRAYSALLRAEGEVQHALDEPPRFRIDRLDADCDGRDELVVTTPTLRAVVDPARGGVITELDILPAAMNICNTLTRRKERCHVASTRDQQLPSLVSASASVAAAVVSVVPSFVIPPDLQDDITEETPQTDDPEQAGLDDAALAVDARLRCCLQDHFFGPQASLHNVQRVQYPEASDFGVSEYQVLRAAPRPEKGLVQVHLARDGSVVDAGQTRLVRLVKRFEFHRDKAGFDLLYEISNRSREPFTARFGVELNLNLDSGRGAGAYLAVQGHPARLDQELEAVEVRKLGWGDRRRGFHLALEVDQPATLWHYPITSLCEGLEGPVAHYQGACIVLSWRLRLWGQERQRLGLAFRFPPRA